MTEDNLTPSSDLVRQWNEEALSIPDPLGWSEYIATQAARWGADMELEACVEWMRGSLTPFMPDQAADQLRAARRPKPPRLAEQGLAALDRLSSGSLSLCTNPVTDTHTIRTALERLQELEQNND